MTDTDDITPSERRELRSVVRGQFKVLRSEVDRRKDELAGEVEAEFLRQYRAQDDAIADALREVDRARADLRLAMEKIARDLKERRPELDVVTESNGHLTFSASDPNRAQARRAAITAIPNQVGDAKLRLDRTEQNILRDLSAGALKGDQARAFLGCIPTVGELVPRMILAEIERSLES